MHMEYTYTRLLTDKELQGHLDAKHSIVLVGVSTGLQQLERQIDRLGCSDDYFVSFTTGKNVNRFKIRPRK